jgi:putative SOS response-associated peptidase YedK
MLAVMCGRFAMDATTDDLIRQFVIDGGRPEDWWREFHGSYSIAPTDDAVIVRDRGEGRLLELVRWDWQKPVNRPKGPPIINARIEKLATGFWAPAFTAARCVVPMRGYYEWTGEKGDKTPHFLHGDGLLAAAGLTWSMQLPTGEHARCFVVITREAQDAGGEVHDRMPAFLTPGAADEWLEPVKLDRGGREGMLAMLDAVSAEVAATITQYVVDRRVNSSRTVDPADPTLIEPAA